MSEKSKKLLWPRAGPWGLPRPWRGALAAKAAPAAPGPAREPCPGTSLRRPPRRPSSRSKETPDVPGAFRLPGACRHSRGWERRAAKDAEAP